MSTLRDEIRDATAAAALEVATELGEQVAYKSKGGTAVNVYAVPYGENGSTVDLMNLQISYGTIIFAIPKQTDFPPTAQIQMGDEIVFGTRNFRVEADENKDGVGAVYEVTATEILAQKAGS